MQNRSSIHGYAAMLLVGILTIGSVASVCAQSTSTTALGLSAGTLGLGVEFDTAASPQVVGRFGINGYSYHQSKSQSNIEYDAHVKLQSLEALTDISPSKDGIFHFTFGYVHNNNKVDGTGKPGAGGYTINGNTYSAAQTGSINASLRFPTNSAYAGIGFGNRAQTSGKVTMTLDFGALIGAKPNFSLSAQNQNSIQGLSQDIAAQQAKTQHDLNKLSIYPVIQLGITIGL